MIRHIVKGSEQLEKTIHWSMNADDGDLNIVAELPDGFVRVVFWVTKDGDLVLEKGLTETLGLRLDGQGKIVIANR